MKKIGRSSLGVGTTAPLPSSPLANNNNFHERTFTGGLAAAHYDSHKNVRISLYQKPPTDKVSLEEFEQLAIARLHLLRLLDNCSLKSLKDDIILSELDKIQSKQLPLHVNESALAFDVETERKNDLASHFILRLAMADSADNVRWFIQNEITLLKMRFLQDSLREREAFIDNVSFPHRLMTEEEKRVYIEMILAIGGHDCRVDDMLVVPFELIPDLVSRAAVFIHKGDAFITKREAFSAVITVYREFLEAAMERTMLELPNISDERLPPLLECIRKAHRRLSLTSLTSATKSDLKQLAVGDLESVSSHFPPCMAHLYSTLKTSRHLKYHGRQQFSLFLKSANMPLQEAILFWRRSFKVSDDVFNKEYAYNIRHNYGQEGKRANYSCPPCTKMISTLPNTGAGEVHGCSFRYLKGEKLTQLLTEKYNLDPVEIQIISEEVKGGHFQVACTKTLESSAGITHEETITSPIQFYEASLKQFLKGTNSINNN